MVWASVGSPAPPHKLHGSPAAIYVCIIGHLIHALADPASLHVRHGKLPPGRKPGAAKPAQAGMFKALQSRDLLASGRRIGVSGRFPSRRAQHFRRDLEEFRVCSMPMNRRPVFAVAIPVQPIRIAESSTISPGWVKVLIRIQAMPPA